jgi:hypothetical protein
MTSGASSKLREDGYEVGTRKLKHDRRVAVKMSKRARTRGKNVGIVDREL